MKKNLLICVLFCFIGIGVLAIQGTDENNDFFNTQIVQNEKEVVRFKDPALEKLI